MAFCAPRRPTGFGPDRARPHRMAFDGAALCRRRGSPLFSARRSAKWRGRAYIPRRAPADLGGSHAVSGRRISNQGAGTGGGAGRRQRSRPQEFYRADDATAGQWLARHRHEPRNPTCAPALVRVATCAGWGGQFSGCWFCPRKARRSRRAPTPAAMRPACSGNGTRRPQTMASNWAATRFWKSGRSGWRRKTGRGGGRPPGAFHQCRFGQGFRLERRDLSRQCHRIMAGACRRIPEKSSDRQQHRTQDATPFFPCGSAIPGGRHGFSCAPDRSLPTTNSLSANMLRSSSIRPSAGRPSWASICPAGRPRL